MKKITYLIIILLTIALFGCTQEPNSSSLSDMSDHYSTLEDNNKHEIVEDSEKEEQWKEQNYFQKTIDDFHSSEKLKYNEEILDSLLKISYTAVETNITDNTVLILTSLGMTESYYGGISTYDAVEEIDLTWYDVSNNVICVQTFTKNSEKRYVPDGEIVWQNENYKQEYVSNHKK